MKFIVKSILVLIAMMFVATSSFSQTSDGTPLDGVAKKWVKTVELNKQFPNPDKVAIGDTIWVEVGGNKKCFVASENLDSQWAATVAALRELSSDKNTPINVKVVPKNEGHEKMLWFIIYALIALIILIGIIIYSKKQIKREQERNAKIFAEEENIQNSSVIAGPPILERVPDLATCSDEQVAEATELATTNIYHRPFSIIGDIEKGTLNGVLKLFYKDGSFQNINFENEPGVRARIHFLEPDEEKVLCYRSACFNPVHSAQNAEYLGTFTPEGSNPEVIETSEKETTELIEALLCPPDLTEMQVPAPVVKEDAPVAKEEIVPETKKEVEVKEIKLTEITVGKTTLKGDILVNKSTIGFITKIMKEASLSYAPSEKSEKNK